MTKRMLTTGEVGHYCGVHFRTVSRWIAQGRLKGHRLPGGRGDYRVQVGDFIDFLHANGLPVPPELIDTSRRVLIVEDEVNMARAIERALRKAGFETRIATDGLQAGVLLQTYSPAVMTLDLKMPGTGGFEVLRFLQTTPGLPRVKVLVVSALPRKELERAVAQGAADALSKPFENSELVARVQALAGVEPGEAAGAVWRRA